MKGLEALIAALVLQVCFFINEAQGKRIALEIREKQMYVDGEAFPIKGLCYSPVPIGPHRTFMGMQLLSIFLLSVIWTVKHFFWYKGEHTAWPPYGDYFSIKYAYIWKRDLLLIKQMVVPTCRLLKIFLFATVSFLYYFLYSPSISNTNNLQGVNIVRLYGWSNKEDHTAFLDELDAHGLKAMVTFYLGICVYSTVTKIFFFFLQ